MSVVERKTNGRPEISDEAWKRVHAAVEEYDPKRYEACETDQLLQALFAIITDEIERVPERSEYCQSCRFWDDLDDGRYGICRRRSPAPYLRYAPSDTEEELRKPYWPKVHKSEWCGEHEALK